MNCPECGNPHYFLVPRSGRLPLALITYIKLYDRYCSKCGHTATYIECPHCHTIKEVES